MRVFVGVCAGVCTAGIGEASLVPALHEDSARVA